MTTDDMAHIMSTTGYPAVGHRLRALADRVGVLEAENRRLVARIAVCPYCGGDYAVTGLEVECPCRLQAENDKLRDELDRTRGELEAANKHVEIVCDARDDIHKMHVKALTDISKLHYLLRQGVDLWDGNDGGNLGSDQWCVQVEAALRDAPGEKGGAK